MCLFSSLYGDVFVFHIPALHYFSAIVWILNVILLITFIIELHCLRNKKLCQLSHAYSVVLLSMLSSFISSSFFLSSNTNIVSISHTNYFHIICQFGPIIAISFRTMSKSFTWGLYIIRGQMVMEALDSICFSKFAKYAPYILTIQCISITTLIIIFTETNLNEIEQQCSVQYPLWLLISSALIGEFFYGLGFMYIFYRAMSNSMDNVFKSMRVNDTKHTKQQIRHHMTIYMIQLIISILFLLFVSSCICFQTLVFFEAELFLSNLCLLLLFRNKWTLCKKACNKYSVCSCSCCLNERQMADHLKTSKLEASVLSNTVSFRSLRSASKRIVSQMQHTPNYFFSNKWRTNKEVVSIKHTLKSSIPQSANTKVLELIGVDIHNNNNNNNNNLKSSNHTDTDGMPSYIPRLGGFPATESVEIVTRSETHKTNDSHHNSDHSITFPMPSTAPTTPERLIMVHSMSEAFNCKLHSITDNESTENKSTDDMNINSKYNTFNEGHNPLSIVGNAVNIEHISQSTSDLMRLATNHRKEQINHIDTHSEHLLMMTDNIHPDFMMTKSTPIPNVGNNSGDKSPESPSSSSVKVMVTAFLDRFKSKSDGKTPVNDICSFSDPISTMHETMNKERCKIQKGRNRSLMSTNTMHGLINQNNMTIQSMFNDAINASTNTSADASCISTKL